MRAITVRQPWARALAEGPKDVENRSSGFPLIEDEWLLVHASSAWSLRGARSPLIREAFGADLDRCAELRQGARPHFPFPPALLLGAVHVGESHRAMPGCCPSPWAEIEYVAVGGKVVRDPVHLVVDDRRPLDVPVAYKDGCLGLWTPPGDVLEFVAPLLDLEPS